MNKAQWLPEKPSALPQYFGKNKSDKTKNFEHVGKGKYHNTYYICLHDYLWPNSRQKYSGNLSHMCNHIETCKRRFNT